MTYKNGRVGVILTEYHSDLLISAVEMSNRDIYDLLGEAVEKWFELYRNLEEQEWSDE